MNTVSSFPLKRRDPAEWHATEELVENQGSEPGNRLVKEPATTASSMGYKQHRVDLKQNAEEGGVEAGRLKMCKISEEREVLSIDLAFV